MSAGIQSSKTDFDQRLGSLSLQTLQLFTAWEQLKVKIDAMYDGQLLAMNYSQQISDPTSPPQVAVGTPATNSLLSNTTYYVAYAWGISGSSSPSATKVSPPASFQTAASPAPENVTVPAAPAGVTALYVYLGTSPTSLMLNQEVPNPNTTGSTEVTITGPSAAGSKLPATINTTGDLENIRNLMTDLQSFIGIFTGSATLSQQHDFTATLKPFAGMGY